MRRHDKLKKELQESVKRASLRRPKQLNSTRRLWRSNALLPEPKPKHVRPENAKLVNATQSKH